MSSYIVYPDYDVDSEVTFTLTKEEINLLVEVLLFSSSVNIGADWRAEDYKKMLFVAQKLKEKNGKDLRLDNVWFYKEEKFEDEFTEEIIENFSDKLRECGLNEI
jgi:hypothetical protein